MTGWTGRFGPLRSRVLVVEPDLSRARLVAAAIAARLPQAEVEITFSLFAAEERLAAVPFAAVVAGARLGGGPQDVMERLRGKVRGPLIVLGVKTMPEALEAMRLGAEDALIQPVVPHLVAERLAARMAEHTAKIADRALSISRRPVTLGLGGQAAE
ncbi:hypothetical protein [Terrihabitans sp. B22-R8]|uniref:hypothetical protein n=1 Tax=Terrihabitans sp. B22-R8 TaxID=3425128 RepID=UPI00403C2E10